MRPNRSVPPCPVIPVLIYPDPNAAADWLSKAFGFTVRLRIPNHRIQMKAGEGCFTIAEGNVTPNSSHTIQVRIEDAPGHCNRARNNGAAILSEPQEHPYGERQYNAQDFSHTDGTSRKPLPMSLPKSGVAGRFIWNDAPGIIRGQTEPTPLCCERSANITFPLPAPLLPS
jgi:uncharacterized glyoxalase superfamily protein PhnB